MDNIFSQISKTLNPEPKKEEKNSRNEFFKMQKNYSSKNVDSFTYKKESVKDASLSEAERNVLYGK
ncbi:MAG TPA: hypothetical protein PLI19_02820 [Erysipelotrichaceae bacterium]|nr:hypothetical protein [Erysipelotrichaceae bacterium]